MFMFCCKWSAEMFGWDFQAAWRRYDGPLPEDLVSALRYGGAEEARRRRAADRDRHVAVLARDALNLLTHRREAMDALAAALDERLEVLGRRLVACRML